MGANLILNTNRKYDQINGINQNTFCTWVVQHVPNGPAKLESDWWNGSWAIKATPPTGASGYSYVLINAGLTRGRFYPNTTYTLSYDTDVDWLDFYNIARGNSTQKLVVQNTITCKKENMDGIVHKEYTFLTKPATDSVWSNYQDSGIYFNASMLDVCHVNNLKLEIGDRATLYTPNPLDFPSIPLCEDMFEQGMIHIESAQGLTYPETKVAETVPDRIRSKELISVNADAVAVHVADGVAFYLTEFKDGKYLGINENYHSWQTKDDWIPLYPETNQIALAFSRVNNQHILPSEIAQICGGGVDVLSTKATASITLSRVNDGADAFTIVYDSPSGLEFSDTVKSIAITAKIFKGGKELTDAEVNKFGAIKWYQVGVAAAIATGKTLTLTAPKEVYATLEN